MQVEIEVVGSEKKKQQTNIFDRCTAQIYSRFANKRIHLSGFYDIFLRDYFPRL